jgi:hypothetical protein
MKVLLICKGEYRYLFPGIANALAERHRVRVSAVVFASTTALMLERTHAFQSVFNLAEWLKVQDRALPDCLELLREFESLHRVRINTMVHADRILKNYAEEDTIRILAGVLQFWRDVCQRYSPDVIVGEVACATEWMGWLTAHSCGVPYFIPYPTPAANRFFFIDRPDGTWRRMESAFLASKKRKLSTDELLVAETFIRSFRAKKTKPPFLEWAEHSPLAPQPSRLARRIRRVPFRIRTYLADSRFEVGSYHGTAPWRPIWEDAARIVRHVASETRIFDRSVDETKRSVYFPLHVQPEFTTDVRAPFHANQLALIESVSKAVPVGYQVLVKEHPGMSGERSLHYYKELKKLHNVRLLSPRFDSHDLIRKSDVILTIAGSSAWEAILYEKPVIAFGPLCYGFCDLVYHCQNVAELSRMLSEALERFIPDHDLLLKFVWAFLESAHELQWGDPIRQPQITERRNCDRIADAIVAELTRETSLRKKISVLAHV